jgi:hypothetical protein
MSLQSRSMIHTKNVVILSEAKDLQLLKLTAAYQVHPTPLHRDLPGLPSHPSPV